jgi:DNA helicase TIP49 (TBP-interacting protein)
MQSKIEFESFFLTSRDQFLIKNILRSGIEKKILPGIPILIYCKFEFQKEWFVSDLKNSSIRKFPFSRLSIDFNLKREPEQLVEIFKTQKKAIGIRISECIEFYEGEVIDIVFNSRSQKDKVYNFHAILGLKTLEGKLRLKISGTIFNELIVKKVKKGNVIRIIPHLYLIQNFGESVNSNNDEEINLKNFFSIPKGKVFKKKILTKEMTLYDFEFENFKDNNDFRFMNIKNFKRLNYDTEILLGKYIQVGKASVSKGIMVINESYDLTPLCFQSLTDLSNEYPVPTIVILTNKMNPVSIPNFKLDSFEFNGLYNCLSISIEKFERDEIFNLISENFLKKKKLITGSGFQLIKKILQNSNLNFCLNVVSLSNIAINGKNLHWICKNTLNFFNSIILNMKEFIVLKLSKNHFNKIHRSF